MNYQEMSDFEIDCLVVSLVHDDFKIEKDKEIILVKEEVCEGIVMERPCYPTSSWADAGPIIQQNRIAIIPERDGTWFAMGNPKIKNNWRVEETGSFHNESNPLRAAMIVFLMMKGGE